MLKISTNELGESRKVEIDGHVYTVRRKAPAGDQMDISMMMRELTKLSKKEKKGELTEEDDARIEEMQSEILKITAKTFDDGGDGSKSIELVRKLNEDQMQQLIDKIFENREVEDEASEKEGTQAS